MKTYIIYSLDSLLPVAVGEQINSEAARARASELTGLPYCNLLAERVDMVPTLGQWLRDDSSEWFGI